MRRFTRLTMTAVAAACLAALVVPAAAARTASPGLAPPQPERFTVQFSFIDGVVVNDVSAAGPVAMFRGTDQEINNGLDILSDSRGDSVVLPHAGFSTPEKDMTTCTLLVTKNDVWWAFRPGGTGAWRHAHGRGVFTLRAMFGFKLVNGGQCSLALIPPKDLAQLATLNASPYRKYVEFADIALRGSGVASVPS